MMHITSVCVWCVRAVCGLAKQRPSKSRCDQCSIYFHFRDNYHSHVNYLKKKLDLTVAVLQCLQSFSVVLVTFRRD